jgi:hypothetical protein
MWQRCRKFRNHPGHAVCSKSESLAPSSLRSDLTSRTLSQWLDVFSETVVLALKLSHPQKSGFSAATVPSLVALYCPAPILDFLCRRNVCGHPNHTTPAFENHTACGVSSRFHELLLLRPLFPFGFQDFASVVRQATSLKWRGSPPPATPAVRCSGGQ